MDHRVSEVKEEAREVIEKKFKRKPNNTLAPPIDIALRNEGYRPSEKVNPANGISGIVEPIPFVLPEHNKVRYDRQTDGHKADRQTDRQTDTRQTDRQTDSQPAVNADRQNLEQEKERKDKHNSKGNRTKRQDKQ